MTPEPCPECNGKCCRDDYGYKVEHMGAEFYEHTCEACLDGTKYIPPRTAEDERASIVAWMRNQANEEHYIEVGTPLLSPAGRGLLLLYADYIERGEHTIFAVPPKA